ncbi:PREDICTED: MATH domain and coiled-coil domain-containing protein At2g42460-like [Camelina sativa]|uniref:MATH domain and coiled-coil domain-containing protein At2g42460-like n=1 Tax=Camelina sativa TaxID=90675 RepID=A0ABM1R7G6_CAMSA|nr:PREDICTED: MATH domain and coiled-coil domain-containing protein At2g42460-like [Camelina sativa]
MGTELKMSFTWKIDNFSDRKERMMSEPFSCGGCEWRARFFFVILNHSGKELYRSYYDGRSRLFCAEATPWAWGVKGLLSLTELQDPENNILTVQVFVEVDEVVHQGQSTENDLLEFEGVQILASQAHSVTRLLRNHLGFNVDFAPKYRELRAVYYTLLVSLIETLMSKSPQSLSLAELTNAQSQLTELTKAGFKLDFLESKLEELFLDRKKVAVQLEERVKNVELTLEKIKYAADARGLTGSNAAVAVAVTGDCGSGRLRFTTG